MKSESPQRQFDATLPLCASRRAYPDSEDIELTAYLEGLLAEYRSVQPGPVPACPHCQSSRTRFHCRPNQRHPLPLFKCRVCDRTYSRLTGTPLFKLRHADKMPAFIRLLSQQISIEEATKRLSVDYASISNWIARFRELLLLHDPSGQWEARVRLGIKFQFHGVCPRCQNEGTFQHGGTTLSGERQAICPACEAMFAVSHLATPGQLPAIAIVHDPMVTAVRRRKKDAASDIAPIAAEGAVVQLPAPVLPTAMVTDSQLSTLPGVDHDRLVLQLPVRRRG